MRKCHGGLDTIVATVIMVVLVVLIIVTSVMQLSRDSGQTLNQSVGKVAEAQDNELVNKTTINRIHFEKP